MGIFRSKFISNNEKFRQSKKLTKNLLINPYISWDTEMLIPKRVINNSYLTYDCCDSEIRFQFRVTLLNDNLKVIHKGHLVMTKNDLIFYQNDLESAVLTWPLTTLRWYAYSQNLFIFQCGRKALTGEGTFIFSCNEFQMLKKSFDLLMLKNSCNSCNFLNHNSMKDSKSGKTSKLLNAHMQFSRSQSVNNTSDHFIDRYAMLQDFRTTRNVNCREIFSSNVSDLTSTESTMSSDAINVSTAENYLTGVNNGGQGGHYLVAVPVESIHGYVNQDEDQLNHAVPTSQLHSNIFPDYQNVPPINYSQLLHVNENDIRS